MSETVEPALSPEQWAAVNADGQITERLRYAADEVTLWQVHLQESVGRHGLAALALHGQPFGFTREDLETLRRAIHYDPTTGDLSMALESLLARIEALLPPTPTETP